MKIDLSKALLSFAGKPLSDGSEEGKTVTLDTVVLTALMSVTKEDQNAKSEQKVMVFKLGQKVAAAKGKVVDLTPEELTLIRARINAVYAAPIIVGAAMELLG